MKKALFATTALVLSAGVAAADVTISGYGRTGIIYYENDVDGLNETTVVSRLRMNIDASTTTDSGIDFGARFRLQWDQGESNADANPGKLYVTAQGLTVEVGNIDTAIDNSGLIYATELGSYDRSVGFSAVTGDWFAYAAKDYGAGTLAGDRVGVAAIYSIDDLTLRASYIDPQQSTDLPGDPEKELGLAVDYVWNDVLELSAAATWNGAGIDGNDVFFVGARYAVTEQARIGLNYIDTDDYDATIEDHWGYGSTVALYGDYTLLDGLTNIEAYIAHNSDGGFESDNAYGVGVNYDLGGARLGASIQRDYDKNVTADMGVRFNF